MIRIFKSKRVFVSLTIAAMIAVVVLAWPSPATTTPKSAQPTQLRTTSSASAFDKSRYSLTDPTSIWVVVNKQRPLQPPDYAPPDLVVPSVPLRVPGNESMKVRKLMSADLQHLFATAATDGNPLMLSSGYRSYSYQVGLYGSYVKASGTSAADSFSARPGFSEHQTGLAVDVEPLNQQCDVNICFANLPAGKWIAANAYKYGFILRYAAGKTAVTGFNYEPWHLRYVGTQLALQMQDQQIKTLEEFFGLPAAPDYSR